MDLARRRPGAASVFLRSGPPLCGRSAPRRRSRRAHRHKRAGAGRGRCLVRRHRPERRQDGFDRDAVRLHGDARPSRLDRREARRARGGGFCRGDRRSKRRRGAGRSIRVLRRSCDERSAGLCRPADAAALARSAGVSIDDRDSGNKRGPCSRFATGGLAGRSRAEARGGGVADCCRGGSRRHDPGRRRRASCASPAGYSRRAGYPCRAGACGSARSTCSSCSRSDTRHGRAACFRGDVSRAIAHPRRSSRNDTWMVRTRTAGCVAEPGLDRDQALFAFRVGHHGRRGASGIGPAHPSRATGPFRPNQCSACALHVVAASAVPAVACAAHTRGETCAGPPPA